MTSIPDWHINNTFFVCVEDQQRSKTETEQHFCLACLKAQEVDDGSERFFFFLSCDFIFFSYEQ